MSEVKIFETRCHRIWSVFIRRPMHTREGLIGQSFADRCKGMKVSHTCDIASLSVTLISWHIYCNWLCWG